MNKNYSGIVVHPKGLWGVKNKPQFETRLFTEEGKKYHEIHPRQCGRTTKDSLLSLKTTTLAIRNLLSIGS